MNDIPPGLKPDHIHEPGWWFLAGNIKIMFFKPGKVIAIGTRMINNMLKFMEIPVMNIFFSLCSTVKYVIC